MIAGRARAASSARLADGAAVAAPAASRPAADRGGRSLAAQRHVADGLIAEGCYRCLDEAVVRYLGLPPARAAVDARQRHAVVPRPRPAGAAREGAGHRRRAAPEAGRACWRRAPPRPAAAREQLKWAELVPSNPSGLPRDDAEAERLRLRRCARRCSSGAWRGAAAMTDPLDVYLNVSLACSPSFQRWLPDPESLAAPGGGSPDRPVAPRDLRPRARGCPAGVRRGASALRRGRLLAGPLPHRMPSASRGPHASRQSSPAARREARERMQAALTAIPGSLAIAFDLAGVIRVTSPRDALPLYERVTRPSRGTTRRGSDKGICLTYLERPREAIDALSHVVDLGRWSVGDALYWRAWNRHAIGELEAAWTDSEQRPHDALQHRRLRPRRPHRLRSQGQLDIARPLLEKAIELSEANCARRLVPGADAQHAGALAGQAATTFEAAETCYRADIERARAEQQRGRRRGRRGACAPSARPGRASIRNAERQAALSAYNAAFNFVRGGEPDRSRPLLDRAVAAPRGQRPGARAAGVRGSLEPRRTRPGRGQRGQRRRPQPDHLVGQHLEAAPREERPRRRSARLRSGAPGSASAYRRTAPGRRRRARRWSARRAGRATPRPGPAPARHASGARAAAPAPPGRGTPASTAAASSEWLRPRCPSG